MFRPILRSNASWIVPCFEATLDHCSTFSALTNSFVGRLAPRKRSGSDPRIEQANLVKAEKTHLRVVPDSIKRNTVLNLEAPNDEQVGKDRTNFEMGDMTKAHNKRVDLLDEMKQRFLRFKKHTYLEELEHYHRLAEVQAPKFMVIACADSRVCPSNILGLQPGEAFVTRNVANFVPPLENGPSETNAALEFAVNTLEVENILVIGHSRCGGIETLMSMQDNVNSSFVHNWITKAKAAKFRTRVAAPYHSFDQQCRHCEKESINSSLVNLLTYPWIEDRVKRNQLAIHGGYYDILNCTFEKWTLDVKSSVIDENRYLVKDHVFWS